MSLVIIFKMPDLDSYKFSPYSDPITSGGYGPNQVSTIFGFMIAGLSFGQIFKIKITESQIIDIACLFLFTGLGLITFSRGGLFASFISIVFCIISYHITSFNKVENFFFADASDIFWFLFFPKYFGKKSGIMRPSTKLQSVIVKGPLFL